MLTRRQIAALVAALVFVLLTVKVWESKSGNRGAVRCFSTRDCAPGYACSPKAHECQKPPVDFALSLLGEKVTLRWLGADGETIPSANGGEMLVKYPGDGSFAWSPKGAYFVEVIIFSDFNKKAACGILTHQTRGPTDSRVSPCRELVVPSSGTVRNTFGGRWDQASDDPLPKMVVVKVPPPVKAPRFPATEPKSAGQIFRRKTVDDLAGKKEKPAKVAVAKKPKKKGKKPPIQEEANAGSAGDDIPPLPPPTPDMIGQGGPIVGAEEGEGR